MDDYQEYEEDCKRIRTANDQLLTEFQEWLQASGLAKKTITNHRWNIDFYINEYLLSGDAIEAKDGFDAIDMFLGYWFIKKALWSSEAHIKNNAASLKKFYAFMHSKGLVDTGQLNYLKETIKEKMPEWLKTMQRYDDLSIEDVWE